MLMARIDDSLTYRIFIDPHTPLRVVLASQAMLKRGGMVVPLWHRDAADERSFRALLNWIAFRRDIWQEWGVLAEALGIPGFYQHMRERMEAEPIAECVGTLVHRMDDLAEILIAETMHGPQGLFNQPLCIHRFASAASRDAFYGWLYSDDNVHALDALAQLGYAEGAIALGEELDRIAATTPVRTRAERRRRKKADAKAGGVVYA